MMTSSKKLIALTALGAIFGLLTGITWQISDMVDSGGASLFFVLRVFALPADILHGVLVGGFANIRTHLATVVISTALWSGVFFLVAWLNKKRSLVFTMFALLATLVVSWFAILILLFPAT